ncbi:hypothetical protein NMG60_11018909 [Bertholletia excelsa]
MLGAGLQFRRSRGEDRFYNPEKARRNRQSQRGEDNLRRAQGDVTMHSPIHSISRTSVVSPVNREKENRVVLEEKTPTPVDAPVLEPVVSTLCNLERFLESVTPSVPAQHLSKTTMRGRRTGDVEFQPYFVLGDLWESFKEWSAYGAGVPLVLNGSDCVDQYYVPYLSAIQIYRDPSSLSAKSRQADDDSDGDYFRDSSSDGSSDSEHDRCMNTMTEHFNQHCLSSESSLRIDQLSSGDQHTIQEGFSSDEGESGNTRRCLLFEYFERDQPYSREPLTDKILDLAIRFPELKTLRSCDILPSSWISVAWYPIYRIPMGPTLKDLDACFLTFHFLHMPMPGVQSANGPVLINPSEMDGVPKISLRVFGLASYKFKASLWTPNGESERQLNSLLQDADKWLTLLQVNHPDFHFFCRR